MEATLPAFLAALWLGVLTSISPCPLATNIVAISFVGNRMGNPGQVLLSGLLYTGGRMLAYSALGILLVASMLSVPDLAQFLQKPLNRLLGPLLIVVGILLLEIVRFRLPGVALSGRFQGRAERSGVWGAGLLGVVFALSFCPMSAALFFGSLVPLALQHGSRIVLPSLYGIGTAVPVLVFAILVAMGTRSLHTVFERLAAIEVWARRATALIFLAVGVCYTLIYDFGVAV
ncbi:MAG TPA: aromatic aminobenezylarsenical efflux permease ArsG family transporter [Armatimonadota bacterium]|jgi:cytochrome c biogenesis protein CcdA